MSLDSELSNIEKKIITIENYVHKGVWHPDENMNIAILLTEVDLELNQIGFPLSREKLSEKQSDQAKNLLQRFNKAKDRMPSAPWA